MKLKNIINVIHDDVCLYEQVGECEFKDLYKGRAEDIPMELKEKEIFVIGAKKENMLDIQLM